MLKVIIYEKENSKRARLVYELVSNNGIVYRNAVLSWDISLCAEILHKSVADLLEMNVGDYTVHCACCKHNNE